ncbi:alpha/beta hydrolase fold domain-containing protein [Tomitella gaofuii]|uniref:alpha/beta hydrolase fold domain-containing protein n=1 Tax=Tomitella gaofuii TaxID=2760083 RepID=UPI0015F7AF8B|nr:alpha/beta hydrolase fold domain-containing protein [Tomitella gaofuii]
MTHDTSTHPAATPRGIDDVPGHVRERLTPQMRRVVIHQLARAAAVAGGGDVPADPIAAMRAEYRDERRFWNEGGPRMAATDELRIRAAGTDVPIRIHRPTSAAETPAVVYFHGGGFTVGDLDTHDRIMRVLADRSGAAVVGVDYSMSPEVRFPQALHECAGVVAELAVHGRRHGIDPTRLAVAGDSAGAMLSMATALLLRDRPAALPGIDLHAAAAASGALRAMLLYYGGHGLRDSATSRQYGGFWDGMAPQDLQGLQSTVFDDPADRDGPLVDHISADLDTPLPPAYVVGAELDPLADDARALAAALRRGGQDVRFRMVPGVLHSFLHFGRMLDEANEELACGAEFVRARFLAA